MRFLSITGLGILTILRKGMRSFGPIMLSVLAVVMMGDTVRAQQDLAALYRQHIDAGNRDDVDAVIATFADDAVVVRGGRCPDISPCVGKAAILRQVLLERENQNRSSIIDLSVSGDTVTARVEQRGLGPRDAGVERVIQLHTVTFVGDKIARFTSELDVSDPLTAAFTNFARVNRPPTLRAEARRRGDIAGVMATFTDDAVVEGWGLCRPTPCVGKAAIQKETERAVADKEEIRLIRLITGTARVSGNTRTARLEIRADSLRAAGVERVIASATEEVPVDKTSFVRFALDATDPQTARFQPDLAALLRQHIEAINRDDVAGALATLADDAVYVRGIRCRSENPCVGKAAIQRDALEFDVRFNNRYTIIDVQVSGDTATARVEYRGQGSRDAGVERVIRTFTATFKGDKIVRFGDEIDLSDPQSAVQQNFARVSAVALRPTDAVDRGDAVAAVAPFADDAVLAAFGLCAATPCVGKAAIQKEMERQVADKTKIALVLGTTRVSGDTQTSRHEIRSDSIRTAGVERILVSRSTVVPGNRISRLSYMLDHTDPQTVKYASAQAPSYELWVANQINGLVAVIRPESWQVTTTIDVSGGVAGVNPHMIAFSPSGKYAYVSNVGARANTTNVTVIRTADRKIAAQVPTVGSAHAAIPSHDGRRVWVYNTAVNLITEVLADEAAEKWTVSRTIELGIRPICGMFTPDNAFAYVTLGGNPDNLGGIAVVEVASGKVVSRREAGRDGCGTVLSRDRSRMYVNVGWNARNPEAMNDMWFAFNPKTHAVIRTAQLAGVKDSHGLGETVDGKELWVTNRQSNTLTVVDTATGTVKLVTGAGERPDILDFSPDGKYAFWAHRGEPQTGDPHALRGSTPGVSIYDVAAKKLAAFIPIAGDVHGLAVRSTAAQPAALPKTGDEGELPLVKALLVLGGSALLFAGLGLRLVTRRQGE